MYFPITNKSPHSFHNKIVSFPRNDTSENPVYFSDAHTGQCVQTFLSPSKYISNCAIATTNIFVVIACEREVHLWDTLSGNLEKKFIGHNDYVSDCCIYAQDTRVVSTSADCTARVWNVENGQCLTVLCRHTSGIVRCVTFDSMIVTSGADKTLRVWNGNTMECIHIIKDDANNIHLTSDYLGYLSRVTPTEYELKIWNTNTWECEHTLDNKYLKFCSLTFLSADYYVLVDFTLSTDTVQIWNVTTGTIVFSRDFEIHKHLQFAAMTADKQFVIIVFLDSGYGMLSTGEYGEFIPVVEVYSVDTGELIQ